MGVGVTVGVAVGAGGRSGAVAVTRGVAVVIELGVWVGDMSIVGWGVTTSPPQAVITISAVITTKPTKILFMC